MAGDKFIASSVPTEFAQIEIRPDVSIIIPFSYAEFAAINAAVIVASGIRSRGVKQEESGSSFDRQVMSGDSPIDLPWGTVLRGQLPSEQELTSEKSLQIREGVFADLSARRSRITTLLTEPYHGGPIMSERTRRDLQGIIDSLTPFVTEETPQEN